jgi:hypothetical protein
MDCAWINCHVHEQRENGIPAAFAMARIKSHNRVRILSILKVRTGSAEQGPHTLGAPTHGKKFLSKFRTGVLVFGKKKLSKNSSKHREQTSQESITDN